MVNVGRAHIRDDGVTVLCLNEILDLAGCCLGDLVASNEMGGEAKLCGIAAAIGPGRSAHRVRHIRSESVVETVEEWRRRERGKGSVSDRGGEIRSGCCVLGVL
jgi:hypothetical protein